jgi:hypothetical protein
MPYSSEETLKKIRAEPQVFAALWNDINSGIRQNLGAALGFEFWNCGVSDDGWLAAYAAFTAYDLTPYGHEPGGFPPLKEILKWRTMACDAYCYVAMSLFRLARPKSAAIFHAIGWAGAGDKKGAVSTPPSPSPVGNHAQVIVCSGVMDPKRALLLDPTLGAVAVVPFPQFLDGGAAVYYRRIGGWRGRGEFPGAENFPDNVQSALTKGLFRRNQLLYYRREDFKTEVPVGSCS